MKQQLLPTFNPSEQDLLEMAYARPLPRKVETSINLLKCWEDKALELDPENGYHVGDSGGKDSDCIVELCKLAGVKFIATYNHTSIDPPELMKHLRANRPETVWNRSAIEKHGHLILDRMVEKMSMPTRLGRWCCSEYKDCCTAEDTVGVVGVRASESASRKKLWKELTIHNKTGRIILAPIVYWTDQDVWDFHKMRNLPYCSLYDEGWSRLGCVGCPLNPVSQKKEFERWPKYEAMWREGARRIWVRGQTVMKKNGEKYATAKFSSPEALYDWWITGEKEEQGGCVYEDMMEGLM